MERIVYDPIWRLRFGWAVAIAMFLAVGVFGAPLVTIVAVIAAEMLFVTFVTHRHWYKQGQAKR